MKSKNIKTSKIAKPFTNIALMLFVGFGGTGISPLAFSEQIRIPIGSQGEISIELPKRGTSQAVVRQQFGEPSRAVENIGEPPISTWYYRDFNVYFESGTVIHSVLNRQ